MIINKERQKDLIAVSNTQSVSFLLLMADNVYSKGTRVWFPDKELGWISAECTTVTRGTGDTIKLQFVDERGKVSYGLPIQLAHLLNVYLQEIIIDTSGKDIKDSMDGLPPLRNPPLLETADDLATLSHLNEPSGW